MPVLISNHTGIPIDENAVAKVAQRALDSEKIDERIELSIAFIDEAEIKRLNATYRGIDEPTDVLSFSQEPFLEESEEREEPWLLGDVVISPGYAQKQAKKYGHSLEDEINLLVVHGTLHLMGFNHDTDAEAEAMQDLEQAILGFSSREFRELRD